MFLQLLQHEKISAKGFDHGKLQTVLTYQILLTWGPGSKSWWASGPLLNSNFSTWLHRPGQSQPSDLFSTNILKHNTSIRYIGLVNKLKMTRDYYCKSDWASPFKMRFPTKFNTCNQICVNTFSYFYACFTRSFWAGVDVCVYSFHCPCFRVNGKSIPVTVFFWQLAWSRKPELSVNNIIWAHASIQIYHCCFLTAP